MGVAYASNKRAIGECDVCGFQYKLKTLKTLIVKGKETNIKACKECWQKDQPQLHLGEMAIYDPQAIREPRPDFAGYAQSRALFIPVRAAVATGFVSRPNVVTS
jgi:hypothetical protein